ncbi:uncharacterized protein BJ212DRAFT_1588642 [Suillus subaureus]|uniref:Uncharacterized protein n=1 Tax=Suillus subaureus TaxID=48587 RepID=A0A9P7E893_9AGAM|nr:uncharacterized protein BJ212DRAFT_1588642 [Suillus subaureus]KAG1813667.1 hypothetical protein BJ212DRAFT_1588642 [Suillus subaureus]
MFHGVLQLMTLLTLKLVSASLYPIQPIQNTVYYSGQSALTKWIDDGTYPLLTDMGGITIELYCDSDTYLATLARNVTPGAMSCQLDIPRSVVYDGSNFTLRYITNTPYDMIIYSADFRIAVQGDSLPTATHLNASSVTSSSSTTSENLFFQATTTPSSSSGSTPSPSLTNLAIPPLRPGDVGNIDQPSRSRLGNAAGRIDIEKLKFRVVFILWPALLGVTMAL